MRAWGFAWGRSRGLTTDIELQNAYNTVKRTVERWAARPDVVSRPGTLAAEIMTALRADLGPYVVPPPRERGTPAGGVPAPNERRVSA